MILFIPLAQTLFTVVQGTLVGIACKDTGLLSRRLADARTHYVTHEHFLYLFWPLLLNG